MDTEPEPVAQTNARDLAALRCRYRSALNLQPIARISITVGELGLLLDLADQLDTLRSQQVAEWE